MEPIVQVIATTFEGTRAALATAVPLAKGAGAKLVLIVPRIISYATELDPHVEPAAFFIKRYRDLIANLGGEARIEIAVCRSLDSIVTRVHLDGSTLVVGGPTGRWLTSPEERFAGRLHRLGCHVIFVASGVNTTQRRVAPTAAMFAAVVSAIGSTLTSVL
jgi:hypothetical protein